MDIYLFKYIYLCQIKSINILVTQANDVASQARKYAWNHTDLQKQNIYS